MAPFNQEILRGGPRMCVKLHIVQAQRSKNFRIQSEIAERVAVTKGKGQNSFTKRKTLVFFLHSRASGNRETSAEGVKDTGVSNLKPAVKNEQRRKGKGQASSSVPTGKGQTDVKSSTSRDASPATRAKIPCLWVARCERPSCYFRHPPVCREYKCGKRCIYGKSCLYRHADGREKPSKKSKKESTQGAVSILKEKKVQGCASQNSDPKKSIMRKAGQTRLGASAGHTIKFSERTWYQIQMRERKGPSQGVIQKGELHERNPCAPRFEERTLEETSRQEECARRAAWDLAKKILCSRPRTKATFHSPVEIKAPVRVSKKNKKSVCFVVDSGASMYMLSKKDSSSDEIDNLLRSRAPVTVVTANGEVQTNEEAQVYVQDLDMFVTVQLLEEKPAGLSLGKLCSEHGCSYEWKNGETPRSTKNGKTITCIMDNFVPLYQDCHHLPAAARLLHRDQRISHIFLVNRKHHQIQWRLEVPSMHAGKRCRRILTSVSRETVVQYTKKTRWTRRIQRKAFPIGYSPSQKI